MPTKTIVVRGKLPHLKPEENERLSAWLVRGTEVLAQGEVTRDGQVVLTVPHDTLAREHAFGAEVVIGPGGSDEHLPKVPNLQRVPIPEEEIKRGRPEIVVPLEKLEITQELIKRWWRFCYRYCVHGQVVGGDGCPVPGATVTVYSVAWSFPFGYHRFPRATVTTDASGHFDACFNWCTCLFCRRCWPCWPFWWTCWPWWWEWDILHVVRCIENEALGALAIQRSPVVAQQPRLALSPPSAKALVQGRGFAEARQANEKFAPDPARTELIKHKLSNAKIRAIFPWWWWCCNLPNIVFSATQGGNVIIDEDPATDTRWCFPNNSQVTLIANDQAITLCEPGPRPKGFVWERVGNVTIDHIHGGYADGTGIDDTSDLAFASTLDIYGLLQSGVGYYQVEAGLWTGNPSRTPPHYPAPVVPGSFNPISTELYNTAVIRLPNTSIVTRSVRMGPFNQGALTNLYATTDQRLAVPAPLLPPVLNPGETFIGWAYPDRKVLAHAASLIGGVPIGAVDLKLNAFDAAFNPVPLPTLPGDTLTLMIDNTGLTTAHINRLTAYDVNNAVVPLDSGATDACPGYHIGPGGYVVLNVTVTDDNGHLWAYYIEPDFGHGSVGTTTPGRRGYRTPGPYPAAPYHAPDITQKEFMGGTEDIRFNPTVNCCYDFRLYVAKRVTDGVHFPVFYTADFQTATIKVTP
jgi:hypothetical protein